MATSVKIQAAWSESYYLKNVHLSAIKVAA